MKFFSLFLVSTFLLLAPVGSAYEAKGIGLSFDQDGSGTITKSDITYFTKGYKKHALDSKEYLSLLDRIDKQGNLACSLKQEGDEEGADCSLISLELPLTLKHVRTAGLFAARAFYPYHIEQPTKKIPLARSAAFVAPLGKLVGITGKQVQEGACDAQGGYDPNDPACFDRNNNGIPDSEEAQGTTGEQDTSDERISTEDIDGDGVPNQQDPDVDGNGVYDDEEVSPNQQNEPSSYNDLVNAIIEDTTSATTPDSALDEIATCLDDPACTFSDTAPDDTSADPGKPSDIQVEQGTDANGKPYGKITITYDDGTISTTTLGEDAFGRDTKKEEIEYPDGSKEEHIHYPKNKDRPNDPDYVDHITYDQDGAVVRKTTTKDGDPYYSREEGGHTPSNTGSEPSAVAGNEGNCGGAGCAESPAQENPLQNRPYYEYNGNKYYAEVNDKGKVVWAQDGDTSKQTFPEQSHWYSSKDTKDFFKNAAFKDPAMEQSQIAERALASSELPSVTPVPAQPEVHSYDIPPQSESSSAAASSESPSQSASQVTSQPAPQKPDLSSEAGLREFMNTPLVNFNLPALSQGASSPASSPGSLGKTSSSQGGVKTEIPPVQFTSQPNSLFPQGSLGNSVERTLVNAAKGTDVGRGVRISVSSERVVNPQGRETAQSTYFLKVRIPFGKKK